MNAFLIEISRFFSVDQVALTVLGYPLSYIELFGTIFNLLSVILVARSNILTWPVGLVGVALFLALFYQINLYADTFEQIYYLFASIYGWWIWARDERIDPSLAQPLSWSRRRELGPWIAVTILFSLGLGYATSNLHIWLPALFPEPASFAYLDALTTIMSFVATILMARKRIECWVYWIIVDVIGIGLYYAKDVKFIALLYVIFLALAVAGLIAWRQKARQPGRTAASPG